ncbi:MAG: HlyD family secretion protein [Azoarcus sp.]|jgi:multidrug resistance efflux pump|nr:HlyD family secretion protein [Azoarcus sp.]
MLVTTGKLCVIANSPRAVSRKSARGQFQTVGLRKGARSLLAAQAEKAAADLNFSYARITAPISGVVAQKKARVGGYARVGEPLLTLVPLEAIYVEAHFRETQLARVRVGQPVDITLDALPGAHLKGRVESLAPASGVSFSPIPPHNATGNFTKITQRLPVRIRLEPGQEAARHLRVGMSARPVVRVGQRAEDSRQSARVAPYRVGTSRGNLQTSSRTGSPTQWVPRVDPLLETKTEKIVGTHHFSRDFSQVS